jgi:photosystem II stability/assembly factor-like uncharacterized protein
VFRKYSIRRGGSLLWIDPDRLSGGRHQRIYAAAQDERGIFRTDDGGLSWTNIGVAGLGLIYDFQRNPFKDEFWVSTENGLFVIADDNGSYISNKKDASAAGLPDGENNIVSRIQFNTRNSNVVYAICGLAGFYRSTDGGKTFSSSRAGIPAAIFGSQYAAMLDMNPVNPDWLILGHNNTAYGNFQSFDGGVTWVAFAKMDESGMIRDLLEDPSNTNVVNSFWVGHKAAFHPDNPLVALIPGHFWQMEKTVNGGQSWNFSGNGFCGVRVGVGRTSFGFPAVRQNEINFFCTDCGAFRSSDGGDTFKSLHTIRIGGAMTAAVGASHPSDSNIVICASGTWNAQKLIMTHNGGMDWSVALDEQERFRFCAFHPQNPNIIYAGSFRSDDGGVNWIRLSYPVAEVYPGNGDIIYSFVLEDGITAVYRSGDCGESWTQVGSDISASGTHEIAVDPYNSNRLFVPAGNGLNIWDGTQWTVRDESNGLLRDRYDSYSLRNIVVHPETRDLIFLARLNSRVGYSDGILYSPDGGVSWANLNGNLGPEAAIWAMAVDSRTDRLYIGTSQGTWYLDDILTLGE